MGVEVDEEVDEEVDACAGATSATLLSALPSVLLASPFASSAPPPARSKLIATATHSAGIEFIPWVIVEVLGDATPPPPPSPALSPP
eukprot:CAMPEP_0174706194 /NCGR_PEP_ID=MMETSP1094-20130205/9138_1 /TAXON_ID=156173 /ORGANISM="Chrysochromulina brevifilum, Strain UTEX LB 985" /LENGTH=86 /DNA_ID=CAMNT_0015904433 /DNA_START=730 /DNA_END=986 /DNA_ORIENTATION=-